MTPDNGKPPAHSSEMRFALACFLAVQCFPLVRFSLAIPSFANVFRDMLGVGAELPFITKILIRTYPLALVVGIGLPIVGALLLWKSKNTKALYALGILVVVASVLSEFVLNGLFAPLIKIIEGMNNPSIN